jgi:hypothetical protein
MYSGVRHGGPTQPITLCGALHPNPEGPHGGRAEPPHLIGTWMELICLCRGRMTVCCARGEVVVRKHVTVGSF